jgi:hypothetical protein
MIARRFLVYGLISLGTFFALVAAYIYRNDGVPNEKAFVTIAIPALLSGAAFVESGLLLWSNQPSRIRSDDRTLDAEVEQAHLRKIFYQLVTDRQGAFTLIQFATALVARFAFAAGTSPEVAQDFLKHHATTFNANFTVTEEGSVVYQFPVS